MGVLCSSLEGGVGGVEVLGRLEDRGVDRFRNDIFLNFEVEEFEWWWNVDLIFRTGT
jgi:hypothetical protein